MHFRMTQRIQSDGDGENNTFFTEFLSQNLKPQCASHYDMVSMKHPVVDTYFITRPLSVVLMPQALLFL